MKIGVAIPCYWHHIQALARCLDNIEQQTRKPDYVVVSCSKTTQAQIDTKFGCTKYSFPLEILPHPGRKNAAENRNIAGARLIELGMDYISFIDADDTMMRERLEFIENVLITYDVDTVFHGFSTSRAEEFFDGRWEDYVYVNRLSTNWCQNLFLTGDTSKTTRNSPHHAHATIRASIFNQFKYPEQKDLERKEDSRYAVELISKNKCTNAFIALNLSVYVSANCWYER